MSDLVVQVIGGMAREPSRMFSSGAAVGPLGVGSGGEWVVDGPGVGPVHTYLYFDGNALMVATVPPNLTALNGAPVGSEWTTVTVPCEVTLGGVRLYVQEAARGVAPSAPVMAPAEMEDAATGYFERQAEPPTALVAPAGGRRPAGPMVHRGPPPTDESTAYRPLEQIRGVLDEPAVASMPAGSGPMGGPMGGPPGSQVHPSLKLPETVRQPLDASQNPMMNPGAATPPPFDSPPAPMPNFVTQAKKNANPWKTASTPRKIIYILAPIALVGTALSFLPSSEPVKPTKKPRPDRSANPSASAMVSAAPSTGVPALPALGAASIMPVGPLLPAPPRPPASSFKKVFPPPKGPPTSLERQAVDAVSSGNYAEAIALYEKLSEQYPEVPTYKEAIRVLKAKLRPR